MRTLIAVLALSLSALAQSVMMPGPGLGSSGTPISYVYFGYGCNGTSTRTCTAATSGRNNLAGYPVSEAFTTGANAAGYTVVSCGARFNAKDATNPNYLCAIYNGNNLVTNCAQTSNHLVPSTAATWDESALPAGCVLAASTTYRLAFELQGNGTTIMFNSAGGMQYWAAQGFGNWATPLTWTLQTPAYTYAMYVKTTSN